MTEPTPGSAGKRSSWKRTALKVLVSGALMVFLLRKISLDELAQLIRELDPRLTFLAVGCFLLSNVLGAAQWWRLLRASGIQISFARAFRFYFVGLFFNNFLPANIGGDAVKVYDVTRIGSSVYQVIAVTLLDRIIGIFSLCALALVANVVVMQRDAGANYGLYAIIFAGCMAPAMVLYLFRSPGRWVRGLVRRLRGLSLDRRMSAILDHLSEFRGRRGVISSMVALSVVIQTLRVSTHIVMALALGLAISRLGTAQFFVFVPLLSLAMIPPITINGLGVREGLGILLFATMGIGRTDAFAVEFLTYAVSVAVSLLGLVFYLARRDQNAV